ncbi:MAG: hypothetical protein J2P41_17840 [Blastocatellia bacterium]|nr:hypothetical protein [Blastocatellia bacterium]
MDIFVLNAAEKKESPPPNPKPKVPILLIAFIYAGVLISVLEILNFCFGFAKEQFWYILAAGIASDILVCLLVFLLAGGVGLRIVYIVITLVIINAVACYCVYKYFLSPKTNHEQPIEQTNQPIEEINHRLLYLQIQSSRLEFCKPPQPRSTTYKSMEASYVPVPSEQPRSQYLITIKENTLHPFYLFEDTEYKLGTGRFRPSEAGQICRFIDNCYDEKDPIVVSLRKLREEPRLPGMGCLNINVPEVTTELIYILRKLSKANARVEILIRGYADGRGGEWEEPIFWGSKYAFHDFRIYRTAQPGPSNHFEGLYYPDTYHVEDYYMNKDLPNLRARFVQLDLIEPFISECSMAPAVSTYVIDGQATTGFDPLNRRVEIYILLF